MLALVRSRSARRCYLICYRTPAAGSAIASLRGASARRAPEWIVRSRTRPDRPHPYPSEFVDRRRAPLGSGSSPTDGFDFQHETGAFDLSATPHGRLLLPPLPGGGLPEKPS